MKKLLLVLVLFASTTIYAQSYNQGFKDGWKNAYKRSSISSPIAPIAPIPPIPGIGRRTYQDGFADGAAAAYGKLNSNSQSTSRKSYNNISANDWEKVYNSGSYADESKRIGNSVDNAINENRQRRQYLNSGSNSGIDYTYWNSAIKKANSENWEGAIRDMSTFIGQYPNSKEAWGNRGNFKTNLGNWNGACYDWKRAAELGSEITQGYMLEYCNKKTSAEEIDTSYTWEEYRDEAIYNFENKNYGSSLININSAIKINPESTGYLEYLRGYLKTTTGDYEGAIKDYKMSIDYAKDVPSLVAAGRYYELAVVLLLSGKYSEAIDYCDRGLLYDKYPILYSKRGEAKIELNDSKGACMDWKLSEKISINKADYYRDKVTEGTLTNNLSLVKKLLSKHCN